MSRTILLTTCLLLLFAGVPTSLWGQSTLPQSPLSEAQIQGLIVQLNAPQAVIRDQAQKRLIELGPTLAGTILDSLERQPLPTEIKRRLDQVRLAWETKAGVSFLEAGRWGRTEEQKKQILDAADLKSALREIADQTGNPIDVSRLSDDLTVPEVLAKASQSNGADFWPAIDLLVTQRQLEYVWFQRPKAVWLRQSAQNRTTNPWISYNGPFRLELTELIVSKRFGVCGANSIRFNLILAWEPRLKPVYFVFLPEEKTPEEKTPEEKTPEEKTPEGKTPEGKTPEGKAPKGEKSAETVNPAANETILFDGGSGIEILAGTGMAKPVELTFVLPERGSRSGLQEPPIKSSKTVSLSGRFAVIIAGKPERFVFESTNAANTDSANLLSRSAAFPIPVRIDQAAANLKSVRRADKKTISAQLSIEFDESHNALRSYMNWLNDNRAFLVLADGTRIESNNWETVWQSERGAEVQYFFPVSTDKTNVAVQKVEYQSPSAIRQREYPFAFTDIPLTF